MHCPFCNTPAKLVDSGVIYRRSYGLAWVCGRYPECDTYVGCHKGTDKPLGRMANKELRLAKMAAHTAFDKLWRTPSVSRTPRQMRCIAYRWLAEQLGMHPKKCHIGWFDADTCQRAIAACEKYADNIYCPAGGAAGLLPPMRGQGS